MQKEKKYLKLNEEMIEELDLLFDLSSPRKLKNSLTEVFLDYCLNMSDLPINYKKNTENFDNLIRFLSECEKQIRKMKKKKSE